MVLPLPRVVADVEAGGPLITAMRGRNALQELMLSNRAREIENQFSPLSKQSEAASKLAYANLMGPQYLSKLMGNQDIIANMTPEQRDQALQKVYAAGTGQFNINPLDQIGNFQNNNQENQSLSSFLSNKIKSIFGQNENKNIAETNAINVNPLSQQPNLSSQDIQNINNMKPGGSYIVQGNQQNIPISQNFPSQKITPSNKNRSFPEKVGEYKGIVSEGQESGKIRAKNIEELNNIVFNGSSNQATLDNISSILGSSEFEKIRQLPLAGHHELSYYSKFGTPEQQNMVGQYYTLTGNIIKDSARDFSGAFRKGEQQLLQGMKPSSSDTVDTARGKTESLSYMNKLLTERSRLTSEIMNQYHVNKLQAQEIADKQINGDEIRKKIHDKLNPMVTIRNRKTGETMTVSISEARKRGIPNV